jgi:hypothetical protein
VELLRRGVGVSIATGRMYSGTRDVARELGLCGPVGCVDGSHIVDAQDDRELFHHSLNSDAASALFETVRSWRPACFVFAQDAIFHDELGADYVPYVRIWSRRVEALTDVLAASRWSADSPVTGLILLGPEQHIRTTHEHIAGAHAAALQSAVFPVGRAEFAGTWGMVVRAAGADKGTALEWISRHHGVSLSEVVAVGDWYNDVPMLQAAGRSFAMAQAPDSVKAAATEVLEADAETGGGIAEAAERAGLL